MAIRASVNHQTRACVSSAGPSQPSQRTNLAHIFPFLARVSLQPPKFFPNPKKFNLLLLIFLLSPKKSPCPNKNFLPQRVSATPRNFPSCQKFSLSQIFLRPCHFHQQTNICNQNKYLNIGIKFLQKISLLIFLSTKEL